MTKPELLAPAGNLEKLKFAITYGADAVYLGGPQWGLRAYAGNFTMDDIAAGVAFAHARGARVYVTVNIIPHNEDLVGLNDYLADLADLGVDAFIISDPGVLLAAKAVAPQVERHLSTQANVVNYASAQFWADLGVTRIILARELSLGEIAEIKRRVDVELEAFVHGAMCISYSGRCLLSNYLTGRDANRGACAQPCRYKYHLVEEKRPGQYFPIFEDERGSYIMNSKDLCMIEHLPQLLTVGLSSLKIEGRMKSVHYVATVTKVYREALDAYFVDPANYRSQPHWLEELKKASNRGFTTGFYFGHPGPEDHVYKGELYQRQYDFVGVVESYDPDKQLLWVEQRNHFQVGDTLEVLAPQGEGGQMAVVALQTETGEAVDAARHAQMRVALPCQKPIAPMSLLRRPLS
ncbi:MAG: U32 family peptidase [Firmicutes bacterium]|nr:U32 family peptidase [Bacillota bacterium]